MVCALFIEMSYSEEKPPQKSPIVFIEKNLVKNNGYKSHLIRKAKKFSAFPMLIDSKWFVTFVVCHADFVFSFLSLTQLYA
tara:strand:- start:1107 stop:1349 length:243 start_codon:yes stop_codon:yes gene_type:complete